MLQSDPPPRWRELYDRAIKEPHSINLDEVRRAILKRAEEILSFSSPDDLTFFNHALRTLELLKEATARQRRLAIEEISEALDYLCAQPSTIQTCESCGSNIVKVDTTICFADTERSWKLALPVCPRCDREEYLKLISRPAV